MQQMRRIGLLSAPGGVHLHRILAVAAREDFLAEARADLAVEPALLLHVGEGVGGQHFGPHVGVIARRIAAGKHMREERTAVARRHRRVADAVLFQRGLLEGHHVIDLRVGRQGVPFQVHQRGSHVLQRVEALVEAAGLEHLVQKILRDRLAGLVVARVARKHLGILVPVFLELRGELDVVARDCGAGERGIAHLREQPVYAVADFMEHRGHLVEAHQRRLAFDRLGDVHHVDDDRLLVEQLALAAEGGHPGTAALARAREVVGVEQADLGVIGVDHVEHAHVGVIDRKVGALAEAHAVKPVQGVEQAVLKHPVQLEIGFYRLGVEVVVLRADLFRVVLPIPRSQFEILPVGADRSLDLRRFALGVGEGGRGQFIEHAHRRFRRAGHLRGEGIGRVIRVAQQLRTLGAQLGQAQHGGAGVAVAVRQAAVG